MADVLDMYDNSVAFVGHAEPKLSRLYRALTFSYKYRTTQPGFTSSSLRQILLIIKHSVNLPPPSP